MDKRIAKCLIIKINVTRYQEKNESKLISMWKKRFFLIKFLSSDVKIICHFRGKSMNEVMNTRIHTKKSMKWRRMVEKKKLLGACIIHATRVFNFKLKLLWFLGSQIHRNREGILKTSRSFRLNFFKVKNNYWKFCFFTKTLKLNQFIKIKIYRFCINDNYREIDNLDKLTYSDASTKNSNEAFGKKFSGILEIL